MIPAIRATLAIVILVLASLVLIPAQWLAIRFGWEIRHTLPVRWHRIATYVLGIKVRVHGAPDPRRPLLVAANHTSWLDIPVIGSIAPVCFVAKSDVGRWPVFGLLARLQRTVFVDRNRRAETGQATREIARRMIDGDMMVLFAEGTSNSGNGVLPFRSSLIGAAREALGAEGGDVWVQPMSVAYTAVQGLPMGRQFRPVAAWTGELDLLPHVWTVLRENSIDAVVSWGEPIRFKSDSDRKQVTEQAEKSVRLMTANVLTGRDPF